MRKSARCSEYSGLDRRRVPWLTNVDSYVPITVPLGDDQRCVIQIFRQHRSILRLTGPAIKTAIRATPLFRINRSNWVKECQRHENRREMLTVHLSRTPVWLYSPLIIRRWHRSKIDEDRRGSITDIQLVLRRASKSIAWILRFATADFLGA